MLYREAMTFQTLLHRMMGEIVMQHVPGTKQHSLHQL